MPGYVRMIFDGNLCGGAERWSTGLAWEAPSGIPTPADLGTWAEAARGLFSGSTGGFGNLMSFLGNNGSLTKVRCYYYPNVGANALYAGESTGIAVAGTGTTNKPPQCSLVISLLTGVAGKSYRGRMYWPLVTGSISSAGKSDLPSPTVATNIGTALTNLGAASPGGTYEPVIVSQTLGQVTPVTRVSIGDVLDTQRRRRDALIENRYTAAV